MKETKLDMDAGVFSKGLSQHGYGFQYAVLAELHNLMRSKVMMGREVVATELPVSYGRHETRIDILLRMITMSSIEYMAFECKRVNPKFGAWCFAQSPRPFPTYTEGQLAIEAVRVSDEGGYDIEARGHHYCPNCHHIGFVMKSDLAKGDAQPVSKDHDAIEKACGQVCLGSTGLAQELIGRGLLPYGEHVTSFHVLPVVATTAKIYSTNVDISEADIATGSIELSEGDIEEKPWVIYQYMLSPSRTPQSNRTHERSDDVIDCMLGDAVRSVVIVNAESMGAFTKWYDGLP